MFNTYDTETSKSSVIYDEKELSAAIIDTIQYYKKQYKRVKEENKKLTDNAYLVVYEQVKDEIDSLHERLKLSYGQFASQKELDAYNDFTNRHMHNRLTNKYNGGRAPYLIPTATGVGTDLKVVCPICGEAEDITDINMW